MDDLKKRDCCCGYCCCCCKGEKGDTGEKGEKGDTGTQGEKGDPFATLYGVFYGFPVGPLSGGGIMNPTIVPVTYEAGVNTPQAFILNSDGSVTLNHSGMYLITSRIQVEAGYSGNFSIKYNDGGNIRNTLNSSVVINGGVATITTVAALQSGDRISNAYITTTPIYFAPYIEQVRSPTSTITLIKIADIPQSLDISESSITQDPIQTN